MTTQDVAVLTFYLLGYSRFRDILSKFKNKPIARFLLFHDVLPEEIKQFDKNMHLLKRRTNVIGIDKFFTGDLSTTKINTVITFDDGYKSWVTHVIPVLKKYSLPATFFISSGYVGLSPKDEAEFNTNNLFKTSGPRKTSGSLERVSVKRLADEGFIIGGHTINHVSISDLDDISVLRHEIFNDKVALEKITGRKLQYFAYPFGDTESSNDRIRKILEEAGYLAALTTVAGSNNVFTHRYFLHRNIIEPNMNSILFLARVFGNVDAVYYTKRLLRRVFLRTDSGLYKNLKNE